MHGEPPTVYVRGKHLAESKTPEWISDILSEITIPIPFPGHDFGSFIRNFSLTDVHFKLPGLLADPNDPDDDGNPQVSGKIEVLGALPDEMNFEVNVTDIRAMADVFYKKKKMGELNLRKWQRANSTRIEDDDDTPLLKVESRVKDVPLEITDGDVFSEVIQRLMFGDEDVMLSVKADVDVKVSSGLGDIALKKLPAEGQVPVKRPY